MLWTRTLIPTMKESPEGAEIPSHVLMLRAGLVNQVMAGAYTYLPLGLRALKKAERIVREEMDAAGAVELAMPAMSPRHLWEQTGPRGRLRRRAGAVDAQPHRAKGPRRARADARRNHHRPGVAADQQLPADADHALPDHLEVPQRGAAAVRRAAHERVPDEGRLQLRRLGRIAARELRQDVRGVLPHLHPLRADLSAGRGRERADRRRRQPRVHDPGRQRRGLGAALRGVRLCGQPGEGRDRLARLHACPTCRRSR